MEDGKESLEKTCFVVSPIGSAETEHYKQFRWVFDELISPAVEDAGLGLKAVRGDDINRPGSFVGQILQYLASAHSVIADLTGQNPNVFYELGVRHALSPRTILIAQHPDDIPSDLREYRTLMYDLSPGSTPQFRQKIREYLLEIDRDPSSPDSPVFKHLRIPRVPDDLRQTFIARRTNIGEKQRKILDFIEKTLLKRKRSGASTAIRQDEINRPSVMSDAEFYYRLEQLRLLGFLTRMRNADGSFEYDLSPAYWKEYDS